MSRPQRKAPAPPPEATPVVATSELEIPNGASGRLVARASREHAIESETIEVSTQSPKTLLQLGVEHAIAYRNLERVKLMGPDAKRNLPDAATCAKSYEAACTALKAAGGDPVDWR